MSAIEPPSLWPTSTGSAMPCAESNAGSTSSASSCMKRGVRGPPAGPTARGRRASRSAPGGRSAPRAAPGSRATARPSRAPRAGTRARAPRRRSPRVSRFIPARAAAAPRAAGCAARRTTRSACSGAHSAAARSPSSRIAASSKSRSAEAAGAEADVPALVAQHQFGARAQAREPVVHEVEQRELARHEHDALEHHVVEPDRLAGRARNRLREPDVEQLEERVRDVRAGIVHADRRRIAREEARVALLVALLGGEALRRRTEGRAGARRRPPRRRRSRPRAPSGAGRRPPARRARPRPDRSPPRPTATGPRW